jgi:hypothetical protein
VQALFFSGSAQELPMNPTVLVTALYGLVLIGGGIVRYVAAPDGEKGLGFGLATGLMALAGAGLFAINKPLAARILTMIAIVFVLGFFGVMTAKGKYPLDLRIGITMAFSVIEAVLLFALKPRAATA